MSSNVFLSRKEELYYRKYGNNREHFNPQTCETFIFKKHSVADVRLQRESVHPDQALCFMTKDREHGVTDETRIMFTPPRQPHEPGERLGSTIPFTQSTFAEILHAGQFSKTCFEIPNGLQVIRTEIGDITSFYLSSRRSGPGCNLKVFVSANRQSRVTLGFVHAGLARELDFIKGRLAEQSLHFLIIHPLLSLILCLEDLIDINEDLSIKWHSSAVELLRSFYSDTSTGEDISSETLSGKSRECVKMHHWLEYNAQTLEQLKRVLSVLIIWSIEYDIGPVSDQDKVAFQQADSILRQRIETLISRADNAADFTRQAKSIMNSEKESIDVLLAEKANKLNLRIAAQSRDIAITSRRDALAMKAIAVLTMVFLPPTFFATCFAMPLFDWKASSYSSIVSPRFWVYAIVAFPITAVLLFAWRLWYRFEEWRQWHKPDAGVPTFTVMYRWMRDGRPNRTDKLNREMENISE